MTRTMHAAVFIGSAALAAGAFVVVPAAAAANAAAPKCGARQSPAFSNVGGDAAIAQPGRTVRGKTNAGAMEIRDICGSGRAAKAVTLPTPHVGDRFGVSSVAVNINARIGADSGVADDKYDDLIVGIPGYDAGSKGDAGAIAVFLGSAKGLKLSRVLTQDSAGVAGTAQAGAHFGATLASDFYFDKSVITVRAGAPDLDLGTAKDAGGVVDLGFVDNKVVSSSQLTENSANVPGPARAGDRFGAALFETRDVGVPGKTVNGRAGAGAVVVSPGDKDLVRLITQDSACVAGTAEAGDRFGAAVSDNWVGVPGEDVGDATDAGMVNHFGETASSLCYSLTQNTAGVPGAAEAGDRFGAALGQVFYGFDDGYGGVERLLIGAPGEDTTATNAGTVAMVAAYEDPEIFDPGVTGVTTVPNPHTVAGGTFGSAFSAAVMSGSRGSLIGAPGDSGGRAYLFDTDDNNSNKPPVASRIATYKQATGTTGPGFGAVFAASYAL